MTTAAAGGPALRSAGRSRPLLLGHGAAVLALLIASLGARNTGDLGRQSNWTALAVAGLVVALLVSASWLLGARREVGRRRARLARAAAAVFELPATTDTADDRRVATVAMSRYHRPDCQLVRGKDLVSAPVGEHQRAARTACAVCEA